jgi:FkbM family methyltransferase
MIPTQSNLSSAADRVLKSIPRGLTRGEVDTGLYGLGFLGRWVLPRLKEKGVRLVSCYDANTALTGTLIEGLPVHAASELRLAAPEFLFIAARHAVQPVSAMLSGMKIAHASYDAWHVASNFDAFRRVHDHLLGDERSKEVLRAVLMAMLTGDNSHCAAVLEKDQYFCLPPFWGWERECYVDAGAYVGDSAERFIWTHNGLFSKLYAFEPGSRQFTALKSRFQRLIDEWALDPASVVLVNAGLGETDSSVSAASVNGQMTSFTIDQNSSTIGTSVDVVCLDRYLNGAPITFLKADVEGMEMALLKGARVTIERCRPKISICVYHYPTDIPDIANYLASLVPDYNFALRHHSPQLMETVLYCWVD